MRLNVYLNIGLMVVVFIAGYLIGQIDVARVLPPIDPRKAVEGGLASVKKEVSSPGLSASEFDRSAGRINAVSHNYAHRIRDLDQFELRKQRRICLSDTASTFQETSSAWHGLSGCGGDQARTDRVQASLDASMSAARGKLDECLTLFKRKT